MFHRKSKMQKTVSEDHSFVKDVQQARKFCVQFVRKDHEIELKKSVSSCRGEKVHGKCRRLSVFSDEEGIWCVGLRLQEFAPFTHDGKPPAFLPTI